jgi:hypothetical protein
MLRSIKSLIYELFADDFDSREQVVKYSWEKLAGSAEEDYVDYLAFGYAKVFTPVNIDEREKITNWLAEDGTAIVDLQLMDSADEKTRVIAWLEGVASMQQKQLQELRTDLYLVGLLASDDSDRDTLERSLGVEP